ncbi:MAG: hypothetical protein ABIS86_09805 [Streptosporangiaceae bacterium]
MTTTYQVDTGHVRAALTLPAALILGDTANAERALPGGWRLLPCDTARGAAIEVSFGAPRIRVSASTVQVRLPATVAASDTLAYLIYTVLERARQHDRKVTVHATALHDPDGRAVLLLGAKGAGKTSTASALVERGWTHAGDDLVVIGQDGDGRLAAWPGRPTAAVRDPARPLAPKPLRDLSPFATVAAPVAWIIRLATHPDLASSLTSATPLSLNERLRWHEGLARYISGLPTPLTGVAGVPYGPVWPLDSARCAHMRSDLIAGLHHTRFDYLYAPTARAAADLLLREVAS